LGAEVENKKEEKPKEKAKEIQEEKPKATTLKDIQEWGEKLKARGKALGEFLRSLKRGMQGLPIDEDRFSGLLNIEDPRERTRLSEHDVYGHSLMELAATYYEELAIWGKIAKEEDVYFIPLEGEQRKEAILMQRARAEVTMAGQPLTVQMPKVETKPPEEAKREEKKGIFHR
jgi:hypothetical protein